MEISSRKRKIDHALKIKRSGKDTLHWSVLTRMFIFQGILKFGDRWADIFCKSGTKLRLRRALGPDLQILLSWFLLVTAGEFCLTHYTISGAGGNLPELLRFWLRLGICLTPNKPPKHKKKTTPNKKPHQTHKHKKKLKRHFRFFFFFFFFYD